MINFVVVEDNNYHRKRIVNIIMSYMMRNKLDFKINEHEDYNKKLVKSINEKKYSNVYILDFDLPSGTAVDVAREIRENDWISPIIILTAYNSLALDTFKKRLQLLDFVSKNINAEKNLYELFDLCMNMLNKKGAYQYTYRNVAYNIPFETIMYVIRDGRRVSIFADDGIYHQNISVSIIKEKLNEDFVYSSKGVLLNKKRIKRLNWNTLDVTFDNGVTKNLLSKSHKKELEEYEHA